MIVWLMVVEVRAGAPTDWEQTVKAAEKEGQVTVYISGYVALITAGYFQKAFPKIKVVSVSGDGSQAARLPLRTPSVYILSFGSWR
jgi:hypothetical protein